MRRTLKAVAGICMLFGVLAVSGSAAGAQACGGYGQPGCDQLTFDYPTPVNAGAEIPIVGVIEDTAATTDKATATSDETGTRGTTVAFTIGGLAAGELDVEADGSFSGVITVPSSLSAGTTTITGTSGDITAEGPIEILGSGVGGNGNNNGGTGTASGGSGALARTGFSSTPMITLGAAVLVLGAAAVYGSKRRRTV